MTRSQAFGRSDLVLPHVRASLGGWGPAEVDEQVSVAHLVALNHLLSASGGTG